MLVLLEAVRDLAEVCAGERDRAESLELLDAPAAAVRLCEEGLLLEELAFVASSDGLIFSSDFGGNVRSIACAGVSLAALPEPAWDRAFCCPNGLLLDATTLGAFIAGLRELRAVLWALWLTLLDVELGALLRWRFARCVLGGLCDSCPFCLESV